MLSTQNNDTTPQKTLISANNASLKISSDFCHPTTRKLCLLRLHPLLLLLRPQRQQRPIFPLLPRDLHDHEPNEISERPVAAVRAEHIEVLDVQRAPAAGEIVVDLAVVVEEEHALLRDLLAREVVRLHLHVGRELGGDSGAGGGRGETGGPGI